MSSRRGELLWLTQHGPREERQAARAELQRLDEHTQQQREQEAAKGVEETRRDTARQIMGVRDPDDNPPPSKPSMKQKGDAAWDLMHQRRVPGDS